MKILVLVLAVAAVAAFQCGCKRSAGNGASRTEAPCPDTVVQEYTDPFSPAIPDSDTVAVPLTDNGVCPAGYGELEKINKRIWEKREALGKDDPLRINMAGGWIADDAVVVRLAVNTAYWRSMFRERITSSSLVRFEGESRPQRITAVVDHDAGNGAVRLLPDSTMYSVDARSVSFTLYNGGDRSLYFGERYLVGYKGKDGEWYKLPGTGSWEDISLSLREGGRCTLTAKLHPELNRNRQGVFRMFKKVGFAGSDSMFWIAADFVLADSAVVSSTARSTKAPF